MQLAPSARPTRLRGPSLLLRLPGLPALQPLPPPGTLALPGSAVPAAGGAAAAAEPGRRLGWGGLAAAASTQRAPILRAPFSRGHPAGWRQAAEGLSGERGAGRRRSEAWARRLPA